MADPLAIIGTAGAIANIIDVLTKTITTVCDMRQAWKIADLTVLSFENQLNLLRMALYKIQDWAESSSDQQGHELVMQLDSCVTCSRLLIGKIHGEISQFQKTTTGDLEPASKLRLLFKTKDMEQIQRMVDQQTHALTFLVTACNASALEEQKRILQQPKVIRTFQRIDRDTASLIVHRDADSILTATSTSSSKWSVQFTFDRELFITKVYEGWIRKLATPRKTPMEVHKDTTTQNEQGENFRGKAIQSKAPVQIEYDTLIQMSSTASEQSFRSSMSLGERFALPRRRATSIEMQPLKRDQAALDLERQTEESRKIDRRLREDYRVFQRDLSVIVMGSKSKKRVMEVMRQSHGDQKCYTEDQLHLFRPIILGIVIESAKCLATMLQHNQITDDSDPVWYHLQLILASQLHPGPNISLSPEFVKATTQMLGHPAAKALIDDAELHLPENAEYFFNEISRLTSETYVPNETDAIKCKTPLPCCIEAIVKAKSLSVRLISPGNEAGMSKKWVSLFDCVDAVIFVIDLGTYGNVLPSGQMELLDIINFFEKTVKSAWFARSGIILILNNVDTFKSKLSTIPLDRHFPDYKESNDDPMNAVRYLVRRANESIQLDQGPVPLLSEPGRHFFPHLMAGNFDEAESGSILMDIGDIMMSKVLTLTGFL